MDRREVLRRLRDVAVIAPVTYVLMRPSSAVAAGSTSGDGALWEDDYIPP